MFLIPVLLCILFATATAQKDPHFIGDRTTIVHLFEWKWPDIAKECETFLGPKGFAGVQISPPSENQVITKSAYRPWWERYQPVSYILDTRSGDESQLADMIKRCNNAGVRIYVDLLMNHMATMSGTGTAGSVSDPPNKYFPVVPYYCDDFHATCTVNNYSDTTNVRNCELSGLPDLNQTRNNVRLRLIGYLDHLIDLGVAGFRVDAAKHMWPADLQYIYGNVRNLNTNHNFPCGARPFFYQEVIDMGGEAIKKTDYTGFGRVLDFKFGTELGNCFQGRNALHWLKTFGPDWGILEDGDAVVFIDNHDNQREGSRSILTYKNPKPYRAAIAFMQAFPLYVTRIMSSFAFDSYDQGPPNRNGKKGFGPTDQEWGYVTVRPNAHIFWWLHYTTADVKNYNEKPLIIYLSGDPDSSSSGIANFYEIGPLDENLRPRNTTWVRNANVLFVDSPTGTGFSRVTKSLAYASTNAQIAADFLVAMKAFYLLVPAMKTAPLYIFAESYMAKTAVDISLALHKAVRSKELEIKLKGLALGNPWISPIDSVLTWAPYLKSVGMIGQREYDLIMSQTEEVVTALNSKEYRNALAEAQATEERIIEGAGRISFFNILKEVQYEEFSVGSSKKHGLSTVYIDQIMNDLVKKALNLNHTWGGEAPDMVFRNIVDDYMIPVTQGVEQLLNETDITVAVYSGQLDLLNNVIGTTKWLESLQWEESNCMATTKQRPFGMNGYVQGYFKFCDKLQYYSVLRAGDTIPLENPAAMDFILQAVTNNYAP